MVCHAITGDRAMDIGFSLSQISVLMKKAIDRRCHLYGITDESAEILIIMSGVGKPITGYALSKYVGKEHHSMLEMLNRLRKNEWIERKEGGWWLTLKGKNAVGGVLKSRSFECVVDLLDDSEIEKVEEAVTILRGKCLKIMGMLESDLVFPDGLVNMDGGTHVNK